MTRRRNKPDTGGRLIQQQINMRINRTFLDQARFTVSCEIPVRLADLDLQGHVNNVRATEILQEARADFNRRCGVADMARSHGLRPVIASLLVEYAAEMAMGEPVRVYTGVLSLGNSSFTLVQRAEQNNRYTLYAQVTMVLVGDVGASPLPDTLKESFARFLVE